jgi:hypothetical protein
MAKKIDFLIADLKKHLQKFEDAIDERVGSAVGFSVRQRMLELISKGISPINGYGRFPEYKAVGFLRKAKNESRILRNTLRSANATSRASRGRFAAQTRRNQLKAKLKQKQQAASKAGRGYPYSVMGTALDKFGKRVRPVNLKLTGAFLSALEFGIGRVGKKVLVTIGFFDQEQVKKELGHREGANGQPKRPIIPRGSEMFGQTIRLDIMRLLRDAVRKATKRAS